MSGIFGIKIAAPSGDGRPDGKKEAILEKMDKRSLEAIYERRGPIMSSNRTEHCARGGFRALPDS
jgi:hypothetical protein